MIACRGLNGETRGKRKPRSERGEQASEERLRVQDLVFSTSEQRERNCLVTASGKCVCDAFVAASARELIMP